MTVPLSSFAADVTNGTSTADVCTLYIVSIDNTAHPGAIADESVVLGSMFLQQTVAFWDYEYFAENKDIVNVDLILALSPTYSWGSYIGTDKIYATEDCYSSSTDDVQMPVTVDQESMTVSIGAEIGFEGVA